MPDKIKVLFVVTDFYQAGTERFTYEVDTALDKRRFEISMLCYIPLNESKRWADHYYEKHKALGTKIYFRADVDKPYVPSYLERLKRILFKKPLPPENKQLMAFLDGFDVISFMGEYNYSALEKKMTQTQKAKSLIHIMNSKHQKADLYALFDKNITHHFVSTFEGNVLAEELSDFKSYKHTFMPLAFSIDKANFQWKFSDAEKKKIGIFTRLTSHKPIDIFLESFKVLLNSFPNAELHVFGSGDPKEEGVLHIAENLGITNNVFFRGHQEHLVKTALDEKLNLVWFHGYHGAPGGFAGYDICTTGIPQLFWEFSGKINEETVAIFPMFTDIKTFVGKSAELLSNVEVAEQISKAQFNYILEKKNLAVYIKDLEKLYIEEVQKHTSNEYKK